MRLPHWTGWWTFGVLVGITTLLVAMLASLVAPVAVATLAVLVIRSPQRAAMGGGALSGTGVWYLWSLRDAVLRCEEIDRSPSGSCQIFGVEEQAIAMGLYLAVGIGLTLYAALRRRSPRPDAADPSAAAPTRR